MLLVVQHQRLSFSLPNTPYSPHPFQRKPSSTALFNLTPPTFLPLFSSSSNYKNRIRVRASSLAEEEEEEENEILPNAIRRKRDSSWRGGFSLGVDLGDSRTGLALTKGFSARPLTVLELRGQKLELRLLQIAEKEEADEFIIGLPKSQDGKETPQSNKVRSIAGRLAIRAAERGWRVFLQDEHGTSTEALDFMIDMGINKSARQGRIDAYAAMMVLERYFSMSGLGAELVLPKQSVLQEKLRRGPPEDLDFFPEEHLKAYKDY
ncbi:polynucleotidyl transferase, ribonuclease H-like superfamily protein isoform X1 [Tasmannia lanceolata]|uniref:polynucleotidyl transferase, ribonuclease H-like superfamily protein isoform X1 n=1 Tax=Tasmannia lanceolata TaxID=3420 RepID=UPI004064B6CC